MIVYLFKVILCSAIFLLIYSVFLEKERMSRFNRFYLLCSIVCSFLFPFLTIHINRDTPLQTVNEIVFAPVNSVADFVPVKEPKPQQLPTSTKDVIPLIYWLITALFLGLFAKNILFMYFKIRGKKYIPYKNGRLILVEEQLTPHSFWKYIFLNDKDFEEDRIEEEILWHELAHIKQRHTIDILILELITAFCWFNPFMFLYKRAIKLNHEFLADESVVERFQNVSAYQTLLINRTNQHPAVAITSQFNFLVTKKRLVMITHHTSRHTAYLKQAFAIIVLVAAIFTFSAKEIIAQKTQIVSPSNKTSADTVKRPSSDIYAGGTNDGVSQALLDEYQRIITGNKNKDMSWSDFRKKLPSEDRARMEEIFMKMSPLQQRSQPVLFLNPPPPRPRVVPSLKQLESFKNPKIYGVWVDGKKIPNSGLNNYTTKDFSQVYISKLYGPAKKGKDYSYQVDLMTNSYYNNYYQLAKADRSLLMAFRRNETHPRN